MQSLNLLSYAPLEVAYELDSDLRDNMDRDRKWFVDCTGKIRLALCDQSSNSGLIDVKMDGFVLDKKISFKMLV